MSPMPPPKPTTEGRRDRQVLHEIGQLVRALEAQGPTRPDELREVVGGRWWEEGRFDRALASLDGGYDIGDGTSYEPSPLVIDRIS